MAHLADNPIAAPLSVLRAGGRLRTGLVYCRRRLSLAARLGKARLGEHVRLQSARQRARVERRLRCPKPLAHSSDRAVVLAHSSDRTHINVRKREAWSFDRIGFRERGGPVAFTDVKSILWIREDCRCVNILLGLEASNREFPQCVTTAFKTSGRGLQRSATNSPHETSVPAHVGSLRRKMLQWWFAFFREPSLRFPAGDS
jgi:hypothetical protein